jgi:hypothetical protein
LNVLEKTTEDIHEEPRAAAKGQIFTFETFSLLFNLGTSQCVNASCGST